MPQCKCIYINKTDFLADKIMVAFTPTLWRLQQAGYRLVLIDDNTTNGDYQLLIKFLQQQGLELITLTLKELSFAEIILSDVVNNNIAIRDSYLIINSSENINLGHLPITALQLNTDNLQNWSDLGDFILTRPRVASIRRDTNETQISVAVNLDASNKSEIVTGIGFFDHMLEQFAKHAKISLSIKVQGDLTVDDHHTVEDTALALGQALQTALGNKIGITRYAFVLPMDESSTEIACDLSGRPFCKFNAKLNREKVGDLSTELVEHFFISLADGLRATIHIKTTGENTHHMIESMFKAAGRAFGQACRKIDNELPTTKGVL